MSQNSYLLNVTGTLLKEQFTTTFPLLVSVFLLSLISLSIVSGKRTLIFPVARLLTILVISIKIEDNVKFSFSFRMLFDISIFLSLLDLVNSNSASSLWTKILCPVSTEFVLALGIGAKRCMLVSSPWLEEDSMSRVNSIWLFSESIRREFSFEVTFLFGISSSPLNLQVAKPPTDTLVSEVCPMAFKFKK